MLCLLLLLLLNVEIYLTVKKQTYRLLCNYCNLPFAKE